VTVLDAHHRACDAFLDRLERALRGHGARAGEVVEEVRADLEARIATEVAGGTDEADAVTRVLADLGSPEELADGVRRTLAPFGGPVATALRALAALALTGWALMVLHVFRAWRYGFEPYQAALIALLHFPFVLLLWPRLVWRWNLLFRARFGVAALLLGVALTVAGMFLGREQSTEALALAEAGATVPPVETVEANPVEESGPAVSLRVKLIVGWLAAFSLAVLAALQRPAQRKWAVAGLLLAVGLVEAVAQAEEAAFRRLRTRLFDWADAHHAQHGVWPDQETIDAHLQSEGMERVRLSNWRGQDLTLFWSRPTSSGFSFGASHPDPRGKIWVND
jgi:hypothetical protein